MANPIRIQRIANSIREELALLLIREVSDPRLAGVLVTDVRVDREIAYADIYVSALEGKTRSKEILQGFRHAGGFLRSALAQRIDLRSFPQLRFHWDPTPEKAERLENLFMEIRRQDAERAGSAGQSGDEEDE